MLPFKPNKHIQQNSFSHLAVIAFVVDKTWRKHDVNMKHDVHQLATLLRLYVFAELNITSQNIVKILLDLILNAARSEFQELFMS